MLAANRLLAKKQWRSSVFWAMIASGFCAFPDPTSAQELSAQMSDSQTPARMFQEIRDELVALLPPDFTAAQMSVWLMPIDEATTWLIPTLIYERGGSFYSTVEYRDGTIIQAFLNVFNFEHDAGRRLRFLHVFLRDGTLTYKPEYDGEFDANDTLSMRHNLVVEPFFGRPVVIETPSEEDDDDQLIQMGIEDDQLDDGREWIGGDNNEPKARERRITDDLD